MNNIELYEHGHIEFQTLISGVGVLTDGFYPMCGDSVQTEVLIMSDDNISECRIRPDTYKKRAVLETVQ